VMIGCEATSGWLPTWRGVLYSAGTFKLKRIKTADEIQSKN
jgi:hypothetical protein